MPRVETRHVIIFLLIIISLWVPAATSPVGVVGAAATQALTPPAAPTHLAASDPVGSQIHLTWKDNSDNEEHFIVERSTTGFSGVYSLLVTLGANQTTYTDTSLRSAREYCYRVHAANKAGGSGRTNVVCKTTPGSPNSALNLGNSLAYVAIPDSRKLWLPAFTVEAWFMRVGKGSPTMTGAQGIPQALPLVARGSGTDINWILALDDSRDVLAADFKDVLTGQNHPIYGSTQINNYAWHHAAATYDGTIWKLYLDGRLESSLAVNLEVRSATTQKMGLGAFLNANGYALGRFTGAIDEVRIWDRALTQVEIRANINKQLETAAGLVARYGFSEGAGTFVGDSVTSPAAANGTILNSGFLWAYGAPFNIAYNQPPDKPVLYAPVDGSIISGSSTELTVFVNDPEADQLRVDFFARLRGAASGPDFTLVHIPDPQYYASTYPSIYQAQMEWVANNQFSANIVYVVSTGDYIDNRNKSDQWDIATRAFDLLSAGLIPYGLSPGNHDGAPSYTADFNKYFGGRIAAQPTYGGHYGRDYDNSYALFEASGLKFIVVYIEYDESMTDISHPVLVWADSLLQTYADRRAIIVSHYVLERDPSNEFSPQGLAIYTALKGNPNLFLMLSGHYDVARRRVETYNGNTVYILRADYQEVDRKQSGYLRILRFSPANNLIYVNTYSPTQDKNYPREPDENTFSLPYYMDGSGGFGLVGRVKSVLSGYIATINWSGLLPGTTYEWYARVSDASGDTSSDPWTFTTEP